MDRRGDLCYRKYLIVKVYAYIPAVLGRGAGNLRLLSEIFSLILPERFAILRFRLKASVRLSPRDQQL